MIVPAFPGTLLLSQWIATKAILGKTGTNHIPDADWDEQNTSIRLSQCSQPWLSIESWSYKKLHDWMISPNMEHHASAFLSEKILYTQVHVISWLLDVWKHLSTVKKWGKKFVFDFVENLEISYTNSSGYSGMIRHLSLVWQQKLSISHRVTLSSMASPKFLFTSFSKLTGHSEVVL